MTAKEYHYAPTVEDMKNKGDFSFYRGWWNQHNERYNYDNVYKAQWLLKEQKKEVDDLKEQLENALEQLEIRKHNLEAAKKDPSPAAFAILSPAEQEKIRASFKLTGKLNKKDRMDARKKRREQRKDAVPGNEQKLKSSSNSRSTSGGAIKRVKKVNKVNKVNKVKKPRKMLSTRVR